MLEKNGKCLLATGGFSESGVFFVCMEMLWGIKVRSGTK